MLTHICDHVHILALKIAPVFHAKRPDHTYAHLHCICIDKLVILVSILIVFVQEWASSTLCIFDVILIVSNIYFVILKEFRQISFNDVWNCSSELILGMHYSMHENWLSKIKSYYHFVTTWDNSLIVHCETGFLMLRHRSGIINVLW